MRCSMVAAIALQATMFSPAMRVRFVMMSFELKVSRCKKVSYSRAA